MIDRVSEEKRSYIMSSVGSKDTGPELEVRKILHKLGYRYRLHNRELPGSPDIVFQQRKKAIFIHGCFWHGHSCKYGRLPKSNKEYWGPKIKVNRERDERNLRKLEEVGWAAMVIWQCELREIEDVKTRLFSFIGPTKFA
ncbi:MAG: DNA mismatch endonuclease Vsr [Chromatiaceae bacterium]|nr:DNA mismatch endonuclease Vsr [Chromatiaceae bacterium]MBP8288914.1 DNA mismatch endonuclease Vsr [Chromatiaceae bacterium]